MSHAEPMQANLSQQTTLDGFDPLSEGAGLGNEERTLFEEATKRIVSNILKSYTGYFDVFSEIFQNSLDAIDARMKRGEHFQPQLVVYIDIAEGRIRVADNGIGMDERELRYCFRPSVSFKIRKEARGHKGVGATFLAYGFTNIQVFTLKNEVPLAVQLSGGRDWVEDPSDSHRRPKLQSVPYKVPELTGEQAGTCVEILLGGKPDLTWWGATSAEQWTQILRMRTPLGGVYLAGKTPPKVAVHVRVRNLAGTVTELQSDRIEYFWPHEMEAVLPRVCSVAEAQKSLHEVDGDIARLPGTLRNLSAIYEIWSSGQLLEEESTFWGKTFSEDEQRLLRLHDVSVYGCFLSSAKSWTQYQEDVLKTRKSPLLTKGGLQIASDYMIQGDLNVIPLTSTIGYQANTHVVVHFRDGNPDMGRKVFQPEIKSLSERVARQAVNIFKRYLHLMREDTGAAPLAESTELWDWQVKQEEYRKANPFEFVHSNGALAYLSVPQCEQDVVAIFHELVGLGVIRGLRFLATSGAMRYDCCFKTHYLRKDDLAFRRNERHLGVGERNITEKESRPMVLEFKYDLDGLIADFEKEVKYPGDVNLVVCWKIGEQYRERYRIISLLVRDEGAGRFVYGATHAAYQDRERRFEIVCLKDLIDFLRDSAPVMAAHEQRFR
jgi:Histidine kinase-, DNA gyrase B-, and HSP90-like ATPase